MSKKNKFIIVIFISLLLVILGIIKFTFNSGYKIHIVNNTNQSIKSIEIKFKVGSILETISQIDPSSSWKTTIDTNSIQGENSIVLIYKDNQGNSYEKTIVGYLEKGYIGKVKVFIDKIDENGRLEINTK